MNYPQFFFAISLLLISSSPIILAQQPYIRKSASNCENTDNSSSSLGYTCNGVRRSCQTFLTFRSNPPYNSVSSISALFSLNQSQFSQLNSVPENTILETNRVVLVPVTCSCSGEYYQSNTSYVIQKDNTYLLIGNVVFQGLSTCQSLQAQNNIPTRDLFPGTRITVPLRCACPTKNQSDDNVNYLLSYLVRSNEFVQSISSLFGADFRKTLSANGLSEQDSTIYTDTTLLVPLRDPPTSSQVTAPQPPPPPSFSGVPPAGVPPESGGGSSKTWVYAMIGGIGGFVVASIVGVIIFCVCKKKQKSEKSVVTSESFESVEKPLKIEVDEDSQDFLDSLSSIAQSLKVYTFQELNATTEGFDSRCLIQGSVYRGTINGDFAAIKKMNGDVSKEINLLNNINHSNLIRLSGVCFNEGHWYLVYEYAMNGPLSDWIHHKSENKILNWNQRLQIALDVVAGLNYLHHYTSPPHIHKDLNSQNVLIDREFRAKITNFGLARSSEGQEGQFALTRHIVGTKGYMAPEYLENGFISLKLDVYSFGVLMLEIFTGKEVSLFNEEVHVVLSSVLNEENGKDNLRKIMDPSLNENYPSDLALLVFRLIDNCLKKDPSDRPNTEDIFQTLSRISTSTLAGEWAISISENHTRPR